MGMYNIGDKVVIREDLVLDGDYGNLTFVEDMREYLGQEVIITNVDYEGDYNVDDDYSWYFNDEMILGVAEDLNNPLTAFQELLDRIDEVMIKTDQQEEKVPFSVEDVDEETSGLQIVMQKIIFNDPATILFYYDIDGNVRKSVAKVNKEGGDTYDKQKGLEIATLKAMVKELNRALSRY